MTRRGRVRGGSAPSGASGGNNGDWMHRGDSARRISQEAQEEAARRAEQRKQGNVFRFRLKEGESQEVIILDYEFRKVPFFWEHNLKGPDGFFNVYEPCVKEIAECPICQGYGTGGQPKPSYYGMFITIIDPTGFWTKKGTPQEEWVPYDRKLLVVKHGQHQEFFRLFDAVNQNYGSIRGMVLLLEREQGGQSTAIGKPVFNADYGDGGGMYEVLSEEELEEEFGHDAIKDSQGKELMLANGKLEPFNYLKVFPAPDSDALRRRYGASPTPGSADDNDGWDEPEESTPSAPSRRRRRTSGDQQEEAPEPSGKRRTRGRKTPDNSGGSGRRRRSTVKGDGF